MSAEPILDAFLAALHPMTWELTSEDNKAARRTIYREALGAALAQARGNSAEWKHGYRDGLGAGLVVVQTVADDDGTAAEAVQLVKTLMVSPVLT